MYRPTITTYFLQSADPYFAQYATLTDNDNHNDVHRPIEPTTSSSAGPGHAGGPDYPSSYYAEEESPRNQTLNNSHQDLVNVSEVLIRYYT